jgi:transcription antitermination protein NusB
MSGRRSRARLYAVLALYQWQLTGQQDPAEILRHFSEDPAWVSELAESLVEDVDVPESPGEARASGYDRELFEQLLLGVPAKLQELDSRLKTALDRPVEQVDPVERAILRVGVFELLHSPSVPFRVAINEAVDLAKLLGAEQGHRYVNGVLDRVARSTRHGETGEDAADG